jgi:transposase
MNTLKDIASLSREELLVLVAEQQQQIIQLHGQLAEAMTTIKTLQVEMDRLKREQKRSAAPFSKSTRVRQPKRPERKPGSGTFSFRQAPQPGEITEPPVAVPVSQETCPGCGGKLAEERVDLAYITDLRALPRPRVTQYRVWVCRCLRCGRRMSGQHPDLAPGPVRGYCSSPGETCPGCRPYPPLPDGDSGA